jgi:hypothetical protein
MVENNAAEAGIHRSGMNANPAKKMIRIIRGTMASKP